MTLQVPDPSLHAQTQQPKVERYKWKLVDTPGNLELIHKDKLQIDSEYQRAANKPKVLLLAGKWSWIACGALIVALRNAQYFVIDGGHRLLAARNRSDIGKLPCIVFRTEDIIEEAQGFLNANTNRRPMTMVEKFRALIVVKHPVAIRIQAMLDAANYEIVASTKASSIRKVNCLGVLMGCYAYNPNVFEVIWPLIADVTGDESMKGRVVSTIFYTEVMAQAHNATLTRKPWRERVVKLGANGIDAAAAKASVFYSRGGHKVWARGLVETLNIGVRNKLEIIDVEAKEDDTDE